jgi:hypothetical protein
MWLNSTVNGQQTIKQQQIVQVTSNVLPTQIIEIIEIIGS